MFADNKNLFCKGKTVKTLFLKANIELEKSHTCEEGGAHLKISLLTFIDELERQIIIKKTVEVGQ